MNTIKLNTIGLDDVIVKKVGSSGGGGESESSIEYLDLSGVDYMIGGQLPLKSLLAQMGYAIKFVSPNNDVLMIGCCAVLFAEFSAQIKSLDYRAVEINFNGIYGGNPSAGLTTFKDLLLQMGIPQSDLDAIPRITKEEFYTL